ncbi:MAG: hypothetical protein NTY77_10620 [Elusimicrobia bacterium]|nr:hypothetical protein [Elusimicrobiota bacterium]
MSKVIRGIVGAVFCAAVLVQPGFAGPGKTTGGTLKYDPAVHSKLQGEERAKAAEQIIEVTNMSKGYYPPTDDMLVAPGGALKNIGLVIFDTNIMRSGGAKTPGCCANLFPMEAVQQTISERMLASWNKALEKYATSDVTLVPIEKITQSAAYQKEGKAVKDWPNNTETSIFQKMDKILGFEGVKAAFIAAPGGSKPRDTVYAIPRGLRDFGTFGAPGGVAQQNWGGPLDKIGPEAGLDAGIITHSTFHWETDRKQAISENLKGTAKMTISASVNVPFPRWEEIVKAANKRRIGPKVSPIYRMYKMEFEDKVGVPYDVAAQHDYMKCCRNGMGTEAERDLFAPMLADYDQAVDMLVGKMVADLRLTQKASGK